MQSTLEHRASVDGAKALGGWSKSDSFKPCYDRTLPVDAMLRAAMLNGRKPETYFLARRCLEPPADLLDAVFPWVEQEIARLEEYPGWSIFRYAPFNTEVFCKFTEDSTSCIDRAEEEARHAFQDLPEQMANSLWGILARSQRSATPPVHGPIPTPLLEPKEAVAWRRLIVRYTEECLLKHKWKWIPESECWLPVYEYATVKKVTDIWAEHVEGLNGHLSVRELNEGWGAKWKGNIKALKSEAT
ncbi:hypothetical protein FPV67DRAFT_1768709 [Lyophyllum atratum]|nr:hypothetical protein FPV67DRAFT_1768709 [Lyophyllum atratum]